MRKAINWLNSLALGTKYEHCRWNLTNSEVEVNAWFEKDTNCVFMRAPTILEPYIFDADLPKMWNLGTYGTWLAHELGHAFGVKFGIYFDEKGIFSHRHISKINKRQSSFVTTNTLIIRYI